MAAGPYAGEARQCRHLIAAAPFGPNGEMELAVTRTPHVDPRTELYRLEGDELRLVTDSPGYPTHTIYSRNLDTARAADTGGDGGYELVVPDPAYKALVILERTPSGMEPSRTLPLGFTLSTNIASTTDRSGRLHDGRGTERLPLEDRPRGPEGRIPCTAGGSYATGGAGVAVEFGVFVPQGWKMDLVEIEDPVEQYEAMTRVARVAEGTGAFDSIWLYDHFHTTPEPTMNTVFECWSATAGLSRDTERIKIGQMVTCNGYRNPALLAKIASTVDVMSNGRLLCGLGAGWYEHEWRAYGYGFPEVPPRMRAFKEACEIVHRMWTEDRPKFEGEFYTIDEPINEPKGVHKPHPPLWIGGGGERVTLKLVARWGDASNFGGGKVEAFKHKSEVLKGHCEDLGRDYEEITRSTSVNVYLLEDGEDPEKATARARGHRSYDEYSREFMVGTAEEIVERLRPLAEAGVQYFIVYMPRVAYDHTPVERFAREVIPNVA